VAVGVVARGMGGTKAVEFALTKPPKCGCNVNSLLCAPVQMSFSPPHAHNVLTTAPANALPFPFPPQIACRKWIHVPPYSLGIVRFET
jgi:hypothetical protein